MMHATGGLILASLRRFEVACGCHSHTSKGVTNRARQLIAVVAGRVHVRPTRTCCSWTTMWAALRSLENTAKTRWMISRGGAICILLTAFLYGGVSCLAAASAPFNTLPGVHASLYTTHPDLRSASLIHDALAVPSEMVALSNRSEISESELSVPADLSDMSSSASMHDGDSSRESAFTRGSPTSRRHSAANLSVGGIPRSHVYRGESSFQQFVRELGLLPTLRSTNTTHRRPLSRVKVLKPSTSAKDVLDKLPFFPLASSIGLGETLLPLSLSQQSESELHKGKRSHDEQKETPAPVRASTSASSGREAASLVDRDKIEFQGLGGLTLTLPATGLARQFFASIPFLQPVKQSEEPVKQRAGAQQRGENNLLGELLNAVKKTDSGQQMNVRDSEKGKILEGGERTAQGSPKQDHRQKKPEDEKEIDQSGNEIYQEGTLFPVGITTKEQRIPSGETQGEQAQHEKRRGREKRDEGQSRLVDLFTRTLQRENMRSEHVGLNVDSFTLPPMSETLLSHLETFPFQSTIPPLRILEDSSIILRRPSHILREASAQLRDAQEWKEKGDPKGDDTTHGKGPVGGGLDGGKQKKVEAVVERVKVRSSSTVPAALSPTTDTIGLVSPTDVGGSAREPPAGSRIEEARTQQKALTEREVTAETPAAILPKPPLEPVSAGSFHEHPRTLGGKLRIAPPAHFEGWPFRSIANHRKPPHAEGTKAHIIGFPFLPSAGLFSIPSFRSSTSGVFGGGGSLKKPFPPVLLDTHETVARYIEPDDADFSGPSSDEEDRPSYSSVWTQKGTTTLTRTVTGEPTATSADEEVATTSTGSPRHGKAPRKRREASDRYALRRKGRRKSERRSEEKSPKSAHEKRLASRSLAKSKEITSKNPRRHKGKAMTRERKTDHGDQEKTRGRFASVSSSRTTHTTGDTSRNQVKHERHTIKARTLYADFVATSIFARSANVEHTRGRSSRRHVWREFSSRRLPVLIPPEEELVVDEKAREQLGKRADRLTRNPLIERTSTGCLNIMSDILAPGTTIMFEPRPNVPENERFTPLSLVWGNPLGAGANGIVYEVLAKTKDGRKERFALKLALNRHEHVCNAWTRDKRGELSREERMIFHEDVQRVCAAEYEMEMKQRRLLSLSQPTPSTFSPKEDVGKLFTQNQVCVPAAVGRIRGLPEFFVCPGGRVAVVNVAGLTPAASCNLYQILEGYDLSTAEKYELTRQVISAMSKLHALGLLHKDLKSENLLVTSQGRVIIADLAGAEPIVFGLTEPVEKFDPGTVTFVAPERAASRLGRPGASGLITMKANAWSLGMMIYEIWCKGRDPFNLETLTDEEVLLRLDDMLRNRYPLSFKICPPVPWSMHKLIKALLQPNPRYRRVPVYFMWMHPLLRKEKYLNPSQTSSRSSQHS